jgi:hypothetical protein
LGRRAYAQRLKFPLSYTPLGACPGRRCNFSSFIHGGHLQPCLGVRPKHTRFPFVVSRQSIRDKTLDRRWDYNLYFVASVSLPFAGQMISGYQPARCFANAYFPFQPQNSKLHLDRSNLHTSRHSIKILVSEAKLKCLSSQLIVGDCSKIIRQRYRCRPYIFAGIKLGG